MFARHVRRTDDLGRVVHVYGDGKACGPEVEFQEPVNRSKAMLKGAMLTETFTMVRRTDGRRPDLGRSRVLSTTLQGLNKR